MLKRVVLLTVFIAFVGLLVVGAWNRTSARADMVSEAQGSGQGQGQGQGNGQGQGQGNGQGQGDGSAVHEGRGSGGQGQGQGQGNGQGGGSAVHEGQGSGSGQGQGEGNGQGTGLGQGNGEGAGQGQGQGQGQGNGQAQGGGSAVHEGQGNGSGQGQSEGTGQGANSSHSLVEDWLIVSGVVKSVDETSMIVALDDGDDIEVEGRPWQFAMEQGFAPQVGDEVTVTGFYEDGELKAGQIADSTSGAVVTLRDETGRPGWSGSGRRQQGTDSDAGTGAGN